MKRLAAPLGLAAVAVTLALVGGTQHRAIAQSASPTPTLAALDRIDAGLWELRQVGEEDASPLRMCVVDRRQLLQPMHAGPVCHQFVAASGPNNVAVSYECAGRGQGRTALRIETPRLIQIDSQGVSQGRPFATRFEGRFVGHCGAR